MKWFTLYIFDRQGTCLLYQEAHRTKPVKQGAGTPSDDQKMLFGLFFSLKTFTAAMDPRGEKGAQLGAPLRIGEACSFHTFRTNNYKLHFHESLSGIKIVLTTPPEVGDLREALAYVHGHIYVEFIAKNPLHTPGQPFSSAIFAAQLNDYLERFSDV